MAATDFPALSLLIISLFLLNGYLANPLKAPEGNATSAKPPVTTFRIRYVTDLGDYEYKDDEDEHKPTPIAQPQDPTQKSVPQPCDYDPLSGPAGALYPTLRPQRLPVPGSDRASGTPRGPLFGEDSPGGVRDGSHLVRPTLHGVVLPCGGGWRGALGLRGAAEEGGAGGAGGGGEGVCGGGE